MRNWPKSPRSRPSWTRRCRTGAAPARRDWCGDRCRGQLGRGLQRDLARLPPLYQRRKDLADGILRDIDTLRWLNIDIQDEVDPLLNDYDFNIRARMLELQQQDDAGARAMLVAQVARDRQLRDAVFQIGTDAGSTVTLLLQIAVSNDARQIEQLSGLAGDLWRGWANPFQPRWSGPVLTLRQSVERLRALVDPPAGPAAALVQRRLAGVALQAEIFGNIQSVQEGVARVQDQRRAAGHGGKAARAGRGRARPRGGA